MKKYLYIFLFFSFISLSCGEYIYTSDPDGTCYVREGSSTYGDIVYTITPYEETYRVRKGSSTYGDIVYTITPYGETYRVRKGSSTYGDIIYTIRP